MPNPLLDIRNLTFEVDRHSILDRLDLAIESQEIHALLGANGSGKTTLAYVLMGCEGYAPSAGTVQFDGTDLLPMKMHERARLGLTLAWQEPARFEGVTVREYLTLGKPDCDPDPALRQVGLAPERYLNRRKRTRNLDGAWAEPRASRRDDRERDSALSSNHNRENEVVMITSIAFTVYPVSHMERARAFYEHVLGLHVSHNYQDVWIEYDLGDSTFAITTTEMGHTPGAKGAIVAFEVSDLDAFIHKMKERAVSFVTEIFDTPVCRMAVIEDPDGNHITIHKRHS